MNHKKVSLFAIIICIFTLNVFATDLSVDSLRSFNKTSNEVVFESIIQTDNQTTTNYFIDYGDNSNESQKVDVDNLIRIYSKHEYLESGPKNVTFIVDYNNSINESNESNNEKRETFCVKGEEIPNNGIDEDCNGEDLYVSPVNITIVSPLEVDRNQEWYGDDYMHNWDINVTTNDTVESCDYEFGIWRHKWIEEEEYFSVTSNGTLGKVDGQTFESLNVDPLGDHNYLKITCTDLDGYEHTKAIHLEIDTTPPGTVSDLEVVVSNETGLFTEVNRTPEDGYTMLALKFTLPSDDGYGNATKIRYYDIKWSKEGPITEDNWESSQSLYSNNTWCFFPSHTNNLEPGTQVYCTVYTALNSSIQSNGLDGDAYKDENGTIHNIDFYFAMKFADNVGHWSNISNWGYNYTRYYECQFTDINYVNKHSTAPFKSNLTNTYTSPYGSNQPTPYENLYNGDDIELNFTIKNVGEDGYCQVKMGADFYQNTVLNLTEFEERADIIRDWDEYNRYYMFYLKTNETIDFHYNWTVDTDTTKRYEFGMNLFDTEISRTNLDDKFKSRLFGMNLSRYINMTHAGLDTQYVDWNSDTGFNDYPVKIFYYNHANGDNTGLGIKVDYASFRWVPSRIHTAKLGHTYVDAVPNGTFSPHPDPDLDDMPNPEPYRNYSCQGTNECLLPYGKYIENDAPMYWRFSDLECGGSYNMWMSGGAYKGEYMEMENSKDGNVTVIVC